MKLLPSFKSAKAICLAAVAIATAIAGSVAPSRADQVISILRPLQIPGVPQEVVTFNNSQSFTIGCVAVRNLWPGVPSRQLPPFSLSPRLTASLDCKNPNVVKGYTSSAFGSNAGVIVTGGLPFYFKSGPFFEAMGITPTKLNEQQGKEFIDRNPQLKTNTVLETRAGRPESAPPVAPPASPLPSGGGKVSFFNTGGYIAVYTLKFNINGTDLEFKKDSVAINGRESLSVPNGARRITVKGEAYTGIFNQTKFIFERSYPAGLPSNNICFKTFGTTVNPGVNDNPGFANSCI
jgi:hypothetical protein